MKKNLFRTLALSSVPARITKIILLGGLCLLSNVSSAQTTMHTSGKNLLDICGNTVILRGINYAPFSWGYDANSDFMSQVEKTGANCVRMAWYANGGGATEYTAANLDSAISRCAANHMIPIIELHDQTCNNSPTALILLTQYYIQSGIASVLQKHKAYIIVNIANEALYHNWATSPSAAAADYTSTYSAIIGSLRNAGFDFPLMVDAPDCGTDISLFSSAASTLNTADSKHNLIFSAHAYWQAYAGNDSAQMHSLVSTAAALNYPVVLGEFANYQDDTAACQYPLNYTALMHICEAYNFPWICWSWMSDVCASRQMSTSGQYNALSAYGNDIVNNTGYGLKHKAVRSPYLVNNGSCQTSGIADFGFRILDFGMSPNPANSFVTVSVDESLIGSNLIITDITGREVMRSAVQIPARTTDDVQSGVRNQQFEIRNYANGVYFLTLESEKGRTTKKLVIQK